MTAVALLAAKGSPGVTTLATAMVLARAGQGAALIEADRAGGDLALLHAVPQSPGLAELAARARRAAPEEDLLPRYLRPLADGALPTLLAPVDGAGAGTALDALSEHPQTLFAANGARTLVLDFGRTDPTGPADALLALCDALVLVTRGDLTALAHAQALARLLPELGRPARFALIDSGPYPAAQAEAALGLPCAGIVPFGPKHAARLGDPLQIGSAASARLVRAAGRLLDTVTPATRDAPQEVLV